MKSVDLYQKLAKLKKMSSIELRQLWFETFGKEAPDAYSVTMLAMRLATHFKTSQENPVASQPEVFFKIPKKATSKSFRYIPKPGLERKRYYKGKEYVVKETQQGFEFQGRLYKSYSAIAMKITGQRRSGHVFFGLSPKSTQQVRVSA